MRCKPAIWAVTAQMGTLPNIGRHYLLLLPDLQYASNRFSPYGYLRCVVDQNGRWSHVLPMPAVPLILATPLQRGEGIMTISTNHFVA